MKAKNIGITELANILKVSRQTVYYYIRQDDKNPVSQLVKIADALGVKLADLFDNEEDNKNDSIVCPNCGKKFKMEE